MSKKILSRVTFWALCCVMLCASAGKSWSAEPVNGATALNDVVRLACVGDSITYGAGVSDRATKAYPVLLQQWLGAKWDVQNFGASGSTLLKKGNLPYWDRPHFKKALAFKPDVAVILFGANDSKHGSPDNPKIANNWQYKADFADDYKALLAEFKKVNPKIKFFLGLPVPAFASNRYGIDGTVVKDEIVPLVREVAVQSDAQVINLHSPFGDDQKLFRDGVHPNDAGTRVMAAGVYRALSGQEAPADTQTETVKVPASVGTPVENLVPMTTGSASSAARSLTGASPVPGAGSAADTPTFMVQDGAFPWYDRTKGSSAWTLTEVPEKLKNVALLPQQNCANRTLEVPGTPQSITIGVSEKDTKNFKANYPSATETGESIAVKNAGGTRLPYKVFIFPSPPSRIGGGLGAGLLLLKIEGVASATPKAVTSGAPMPSTAVLPSGRSLPVAKAAPTDPAPTTSQSAAAPSTNPAPVVVTPPAKDSFHIYLLTGQSNMAGRGALDSPAAQGNNPRVLALNPDNQWIVAKDPLHPKVGRTEPGVGPGMSFALEMLKADPKVTIGLVPCAVGGTALRRWVKGGDLYEKAVERAKIAAPTSVIKGVLWHQGESDTDKKGNADTYEARLTKMLGDLRADLGQPNLPIVIGQLGDFLALTPEKYPYAETVRAAIKHISNVVPNTGYAESAGLGDKGDQLHFSAVSAKELGVRFGKAMQALQKK